MVVHLRIFLSMLCLFDVTLLDYSCWKVMCVCVVALSKALKTTRRLYQDCVELRWDGNIISSSAYYTHTMTWNKKEEEKKRCWSWDENQQSTCVIRREFYLACELWCKWWYCLAWHTSLFDDGAMEMRAAASGDGSDDAVTPMKVCPGVMLCRAMQQSMLNCLWKYNIFFFQRLQSWLTDCCYFV